MAEVQWYYARNDQQFGPVSGAELKQLAEAGRLSPDDLLWREGMDAWTTAINLRGLFSEDPSSVKAVAPAVVGATADVAGQTAAGRAPAVVTRAPSSLPALLRATQIVLWTICVLVVISGLVLFTRAFLNAKDAGQEAAAAAVFSTFFIAAYVLARSGEKLARLLLARSRRRGR